MTWITTHDQASERGRLHRFVTREIESRRFSYPRNCPSTSFIAQKSLVEAIRYLDSTTPAINNTHPISNSPFICL